MNNIKKIFLLAFLCCRLSDILTARITTMTDISGTRSARPVEYDETKKVSNLKDEIKRVWELAENFEVIFENIDIKDDANAKDLEKELLSKSQKSILFKFQPKTSKKRSRSEFEEESKEREDVAFKKTASSSFLGNIKAWWEKK